MKNLSLQLRKTLHETLLGSTDFFQLKTRFLKPDLFSFAPPLRKINRKMNF